MAWRGGHRFCPRRADFRWVDEDRLGDSEASPFRDVECGSLVCPYCIETCLWRWTQSFEHAEPERYAVLTNLTGDWERDLYAIKRLHQAIRRGSIPGQRKPRDWKGYRYVDPKGRVRWFRGAVIESAFTIEAGAKTGMVHLNLFWHGGFVPQAFLSDVAVALGWGQVVHVKKWERQASGSGYGMKEARGSGYGMKEARGSADEAPSETLSAGQLAFLARNGGRLLHTTRGFWRDGRNGETLQGQRQAFRAAMAARDAQRAGAQTGTGSWVQYGPGRDVVVAHSRVPTSAPSALVTRAAPTGAWTSAGPAQPSLWWDDGPSDLRPAS